MRQQRKTEAPTVIVGVGGGIAAFKVATLVRLFRKAGWEVFALPTEASTHFVGLETWAELSENPVGTDVFGAPISHVHLARKADLIVVAPATADLLGKMRGGLAPDLLTNVLLASAAPKVVAPAMHTNMWENPATQENVAALQKWGVHVIKPASGALSSGDTGAGRMREPDEIFDFALKVAADHGITGERESDEANEPQENHQTSTESSTTQQVHGLPLSGKRVVVTAGGTQEDLDPVRFLGNRSTGAQGIAIAQAALDAGADVTLIHASIEVPLPKHERLQAERTLSAREMENAVHASLADADALIMAAAVADFAPKTSAEQKIKKEEGEDTLTLELVKNPDILAGVAMHDLRPGVLVGFAAETGTKEEVLGFGRAKAQRKGADLLAVNKVGGGAGFGPVPNALYYVDRNGMDLGETSGSKGQVAKDLIGRVAQLVNAPQAAFSPEALPPQTLPSGTESDATAQNIDVKDPK